LITPLYQRLLTVDKVDALFSPFNSVLTLQAMQTLNASGTNIPMVFAGGGAPNLYGVAKYTFGTIPLATNTSLPCLQYFGSLGAKTLAFVYQQGDFYQTLQYNSIANAARASGNYTIVANLTFVTGNTNWDSIVQTLSAQNIDALFLLMYSVDIASLLKPLKLASVYPKATFYSGDQFALDAGTILQPQGLDWTIGQFFSSLSWTRNDTFTSSYGFYNSSLWADAFHAFAPDVTPDFLTAEAFASGLIWNWALEHVGNFDPVALGNAIANINLTLFYGQITFDALGHLTAPGGCVQWTSQTGEYTVYPPELANAKGIYPATVRSPPGFYDLPQAASDYTVRNALIISACVLFALIVIGIIVFFVVRNRYHMIFIPKEEQNEEWS